MSTPSRYLTHTHNSRLWNASLAARGSIIGLSADILHTLPANHLEESKMSGRTTGGRYCLPLHGAVWLSADEAVDFEVIRASVYELLGRT